MIAQWRRKRNIGVIGGLLLSWSGVGLIYATPHKGLLYLALACIVVGLVLWFWGFMAYAKAKGYPAILGICLALLLNIVGLLVLLVLPDKTKTVS
jgi:hypothetical protein